MGWLRSQIASSIAYGVVRSYVPSGDGVLTVDGVGYTIKPNDGVEYLMMITGNSDRTIVLPPASQSSGRTIKLIKTDTGTGAVILDGSGSETINGAATQTTHGQYSTQCVACDGAAWFNVEEPVSYGSITTNFVFNNGGSPANNKVFGFKRSGAIVTVWTTDVIKATSDGVDTFLNNGASVLFPAWARTNFVGGYEFPLVIVNSASPSTLGFATFLTTGEIRIFRNAIAAWSAGTAGTDSGFTVNYTAT